MSPLVNAKTCKSCAATNDASNHRLQYLCGFGAHNTPFTLHAVVPPLEIFFGTGTAPQVAPFRPICSHYRRMATD